MKTILFPAVLLSSLLYANAAQSSQNATPAAAPAPAHAAKAAGKAVAKSASKSANKPAAWPVQMADALTPAQRMEPLNPASHGAQVLRAQVLLDRAHYASGEINATYSFNLKQAIRGYQKLQQLAVTGVIDAATWTLLERDTAPVLASYIVSAADAAGPYRPLPASIPAEAKLDHLGYASIAEALGERFHVSPALLQQLNPGKQLDRAGVELIVPNVTAAAPMPAAASILVSRSNATLTLLDATGMPFAQFPASTGSQHDPLPLGQWKVNGVVRNPVYRYNPALFWDAKAGDAKATLAGGPNNPVGAVWIALSKEHYGIHGTPQPALIGKTASHGCIRLTNWDALAVAQTVRTGARVLLEE